MFNLIASNHLSDRKWNLSQSLASRFGERAYLLGWSAGFTFSTACCAESLGQLIRRLGSFIDRERVWTLADTTFSSEIIVVGRGEHEPLEVVEWYFAVSSQVVWYQLNHFGRVKRTFQMRFGIACSCKLVLLWLILNLVKVAAVSSVTDLQ